ncbi:MAG TPA: amidohydrolase family protein [Planctomycetota bacterium]|nr:amidohydrolase family protein [Planctomycetota bacterium]
MHLLTAAALCAATVVAQQGGPDLLVRARTLYVGDGRVLKDAAVVVAGGRIVSVGAAPAAAAKETLDVAEACVTPGFVEGSCHAGLPRGGAENEEGSEVTPGIRVLDAVEPGAEEFARLLEQGVTTMIVTPGHRNVIGGLSCALKPRKGGVDAMLLRDEIAQLAALNREPAIRNSPPGGRFFRIGAPGLYNRRPATRLGVVFEVRRALMEGAGRLRSDGWLEQFDDVDGAPLARAVDGGTPIAFVANTETDILAALRIADEFGVKRWYVQDAVEAERVREQLARRKVDVMIGAVSFQAAPATQFDRGGLMGAPRRLADAGVRFAISRGTSRPGATLRDYAIAAARGGLPPGRAVAAVTGDPARIVGVADRVGTVEAGKDADLLVFAGDVLSPAASLACVVLDGRVVYRAEQPARAEAPQ